MPSMLSSHGVYSETIEKNFEQSKDNIVANSFVHDLNKDAQRWIRKFFSNLIFLMYVTGLSFDLTNWTNKLDTDRQIVLVTGNMFYSFRSTEGVKKPLLMFR